MCIGILSYIYSILFIDVSEFFPGKTETSIYISLRKSFRNLYGSETASDDIYTENVQFVQERLESSVVDYVSVYV